MRILRKYNFKKPSCNNIEVLEEQYNILHSSNAQSKIPFLEMRQFAKNLMIIIKKELCYIYFG